MLVLSRQQDQKVLFPNLGITVEIVSVKGRNVKLGIDAPPEVRIIREELADKWDFKQREMTPHAAPITKSARRFNQHGLEKQLDQIRLLVQVAKEKLTTGRVNEATEHVELALVNLSNLNQANEQEPAEVVREQTEKYDTQSTSSDDHDKALFSNNRAHKWKSLPVKRSGKDQKLIARA